MFVTDKMIDEMAARYGIPKAAGFVFPVSDKEYKRIRSSQKHGRKHDVTMYIFKDDQVIVIATPFYPPGMYRAPSGGLRPEESFKDGIARETFEETGCRIALEKFLLRTEVLFENAFGTIEWNSFVFQARYVGGDFEFTDHREIREVRLAHLEEFSGFAKIMRSMDIGSLHYRASLHEAIEPLLKL
ncbi:MAG: hypothetical protein DRP47_10425 [Candidatus Zixiibacteriota bacterium]|nr:MAG: hypothetical protein DRP47_10425 [candidate division Zixibacteria bacterium]